ncbi:MAG: exo-alpha-sialidase, partial [Anaerohalosphaera sp.]|nr:exo-alpha-sialidase [Anaerohalosphaera sp.]
WETGTWTDIKTVTVQAVDDDISEGPHQAMITHSSFSNDPNFNNIPIVPVVVDVNDNEPYCGDENTIYLLGDVNEDCYINLVDFSIIAKEWLACTDPSLEECYPYIPAEPMEKIVVFDSAIDTAYPVYRQPAIIVTDVGTILAFCQGRESTSDSAQNDVVLKRSTDGGYTWGPLQLLHDAGDDNLNNIQAVQVKETGRVIVMYGRFPQGCHVSCVQPGYYSPGDDTHHRTYMMYSDDDGLTWSAPSDITSMVREPSDQYMSSPGNGFGFQLRRGPYTGRIIMPFHNRWDSKPKNDTVIYSDDLGETWQTGGYGTVITANPGEVCGVELIDGSIMLNARSSTGKQRLVTTSADGGQAWGQWMQDTTLIEPPCMGTIIRYSDPLNGEISRILFANPASTTAREKGTVRLSYDEAQTWTISKEFVPDYYGYSCLTILPDTRIASFYESDSGFKTMTLAVFSLKWMTDSTDWQGKQ